MPEKPQAVNSALNTLLYWRDVEIELPENYGKYLCYHPDWGIQIILFNSIGFSPIGLSEEDYPTHWMPLPFEPI